MTSATTQRPVRILLVEDDPADVELTLRALRKRGLTNPVDVVRDGEEALEHLFPPEGGGRLRKDHPRLILLDLNLPRVHGLDVLRRLKSDEDARSIPVVVLTSSRQDRDLAETYRLGVNSYVQKPVDFDQFSEAVANVGFYWLLLNEAPQHS